MGLGGDCTTLGILYPSEKCGSCLFLAEQMDELVQRCFLHALKCQVRKADLPLLTSTFLGSHMLSCWYGRRGGGWRPGRGLSLVPWWYVRTGLWENWLRDMLWREWSGGLIWQMNLVLSIEHFSFSEQKDVDSG